MAGLLTRFRRRRLRRLPLPEEWPAICRRELPFFAHYPSELEKRFLNLLGVFAREKHFIGAAELKVDDRQRVVISGCAIRLVLDLGLGAYDRLTEIVVYPHAFRRPGEKEALLGEAHHWGTVVLSWPAVLHGLRHPCDGHDTALHEFAHVLDRASGYFDGTPPLRRRSHYRPWARVMTRHFQRLRDRQWPESQVLRYYGAENEAEFFAVASESFFERPRLVARLLPELYGVLRTYYGLEPASHPGCVGLPDGVD